MSIKDEAKVLVHYYGKKIVVAATDIKDGICVYSNIMHIRDILDRIEQLQDSINLDKD